MNYPDGHTKGPWEIDRRGRVVQTSSGGVVCEPNAKQDAELIVQLMNDSLRKDQRDEAIARLQTQLDEMQKELAEARTGWREEQRLRQEDKVEHERQMERLTAPAQSKPVVAGKDAKKS